MFLRPVLGASLFILLATLFVSANASANGEIGEHVKNLKAHLDEYSSEVDWFLGEVDKIIITYETDGAEKAEPAQLIDFWESVKFHPAIETNYIPVYALIWQGIYGVKLSIEQGKPVAEVREQRQALAKALWQGLGAVKMAAEHQAAAPPVVPASDSVSPVDTVDEIQKLLNDVVAKYRDSAVKDAIDLVHSTYLHRFEGIEGMLIEEDAELVEDLEKDFNVTLPQALESGADQTAVKAIVEAMHDKLKRAKVLLEKAEQESGDVF